LRKLRAFFVVLKERFDRMDSYWIRLLVFGLINFGALGIGAYMMGEGPTSEWYQNANKAPWTPPGWVFGAAWFTIMICFSVYCAKVFTMDNKTGLMLFALSTVMNVIWNPLFFNWHQVGIALVVIALLTILIWFIVFKFKSMAGGYSVLVLPYGVWLLIATSLNAFFLFKN